VGNAPNAVIDDDEEAFLEDDEYDSEEEKSQADAITGKQNTIQIEAENVDLDNS
jgi:hypothetical protein